MKKIIHLINGEYYSGAERVQDLLAINLPGVGYEAHLVCLKPDRFKSYCSCSKSFVHEIPVAGRFDMKTVRKIAEFSQSIGACLIHSHTPRTALAASCLQFFIPLPRVHHIHSPTSRDTDNSVKNVINTITERVSVVGVKRFVAVSGSLARWASSLGINESRISIVPNGVPVCDVTLARKEGRVAIGVVALFRPRKGLELLLKAFHEVVKDAPNAVLQIVGGFESPEYEAEIRSLARSLRVSDSIDWVGFSSDVANEMAKMDIFALPSLFGEGMPMVLLEAMAAGLPVVGTNVEGIPEVVRDGHEGLIVAPNDVLAMAEALKRLVRNTQLRHEMGRSAVERHRASFSDQVMAQQVSEVYSSVLRQK